MLGSSWWQRTRRRIKIIQHCGVVRLLQCFLNWHRVGIRSRSDSTTATSRLHARRRTRSVHRRCRSCCSTCQCCRVQRSFCSSRASSGSLGTYHFKSTTALPCARCFRFRSGRLKAVVSCLTYSSTRLASSQSRGQTGHGDAHLVQTSPAAARPERCTAICTVSVSVSVIVIVVTVRVRTRISSFPKLGLLLLTSRLDRLSFFINRHHASDRLAGAQLRTLRITTYGGMACSSLGAR